MYRSMKRVESNNNDYQNSINDYSIISSLGKGCNSTLFKVRENLSHDIYAMKIISIKNNETKNKIYNDINLYSTLNHPNIIKIYDTFNIKNARNEEFIVIITDYCENGTLIDYSTKYGFRDENEKMKIAFQILEAIRYLHKHGIAHQNIKTENILLDMNLSPKLFNIKNDFEVDDLEDIKKMNATALFKADIWSYGITLYETFELCLPFKYIDDVINDRASISKVTNKNFRKLIFDCLKRNPNNRPSADELKEEFFKCMNKHSEKRDHKKIKKKNDSMKKKLNRECIFYF